MSGEDECRHGFDPAWCASCKDPLHTKPRTLRPTDDREDWEKPARTQQLAVRARYVISGHAHCRGCGGMLRPGQNAAWMTDGSTRHDLPGCILAQPGQATYSGKKGAVGKWPDKGRRDKP